MIKKRGMFKRHREDEIKDEATRARILCVVAHARKRNEWAYYIYVWIKAPIKSNNTEYDKDDMKIYVRKWISLLLYNSIYIALHRCVHASSFILHYFIIAALVACAFDSLSHSLSRLYTLFLTLIANNLMFSVALLFNIYVYIYKLCIDGVCCIQYVLIFMNITQAEHIHTYIHTQWKWLQMLWKLMCSAVQCVCFVQSDGRTAAIASNEKYCRNLLEKCSLVNWVVTNWAEWKMGSKTFNGICTWFTCIAYNASVAEIR